MRKWPAALCVFLLSLMVFFPVLASPASGGGSGSELETPWLSGTRWAIGAEMDLFDDYGSALSQVKRELRNQSDGEVRNIDLGLAGVAGFYHKGEVTPTDSAEFISVTSESAFYLHSRVFVALEARLPRAGTYDDDDFPSMTWIEMEYQQSSNLVLRALTTQYYTTDSLELAQVEAEFMIGWREAARGQNLPYFDYDFLDDDSGDSFTIRYKDMTARASASLTCGLTTVYEPALNVFDFPLQPDESWSDTATATVSGYLYGDMDLTRPSILSQGEEELLYDDLNQALEELGLDKRFHEWDDLFPLHVPSPWMIPADLDPGEVGDWEALTENVTIADDRFVFGPVTSEPTTYHFKTGERTYLPLSDGELVPALGYQVDEVEPGGRGYEDYEDEEAGIPYTQFVSVDDGRTLKLTLEVPDVEGGEPRVYEALPVSSSHATAQMNAKADTASPTRGGYPLTEEEGPFPWLILVAIFVAVVAGGFSGRFMLTQRHERQNRAHTAPIAEATPQPVGGFPGHQYASGDPRSPQLQQQQQYGHDFQYRPPAGSQSSATSPYQPPADPHAAYRNPLTAQWPIPAPSPSPLPSAVVPLTTVVACPSCGGHFQIPAGASIIACPHCGTQGQLGL